MEGFRQIEPAKSACEIDQVVFAREEKGNGLADISHVFRDEGEPTTAPVHIRQKQGNLIVTIKRVHVVEEAVQEFQKPPVTIKIGGRILQIDAPALMTAALAENCPQPLGSAFRFWFRMGRKSQPIEARLTVGRIQ